MCTHVLVIAIIHLLHASYYIHVKASGLLLVCVCVYVPPDNSSIACVSTDKINAVRTPCIHLKLQAIASIVSVVRVFNSSIAIQYT